MAEEVTQGASGSTTVPEVEQATETKPTDGQSGTTGGVTPDALASKMDGIERLLGKWGNELGELRAFAQDLSQRQRNAIDRAVPTQPERGGGIDFDETEFLTKPKETINRVLQAERESFKKELQAQRAQTDAQEAFANFVEGKNRAIKENPDLFEGIDKEIDSDLYNAFRSGAIDKTALRNPEIYKTAALVKRVMRGEFDKVAPARKTAPLSNTELPGKGKQVVDTDEEDVVFDDSDKAFIRERGWTDKEAVEILRGEQQAKLKKLNKGK